MVAVCNYYMVDSVSGESQEEGGGKVHRWHRSSPLLLLLLVAVVCLIALCLICISATSLHFYIATLYLIKVHRWLSSSAFLLLLVANNGCVPYCSVHQTCIQISELCCFIAMYLNTVY